MNSLVNCFLDNTKKINALTVLLLFMGFTACEDVLEEDITNDRIDLVSPLDGDTIVGNNVQFIWNSLEGADMYNVQVYQGGTVVVDSVVDNAPLSLVLNSDDYMWRVKGENFAYETAFTFPQEFSVEASNDLSTQSVQLLSPSDDFYTNSTPIIFNWTAIEFATHYEFTLLKITASGAAIIYESEPLTDTSLSLDATVLTEDAVYEWEVIAVNTANETQTIASSRTFSIDTVAPSVPSLLTPAFEQEFELDESIAFTWNFATDTGAVVSAVTSVFEIATDDAFTNVVFNGQTETTSVTQAFSIAGTYFWRVRGEDLAGNVGGYNLNGKFIVNE